MTLPPETVRLGLRANWRQFSLLVLVNAFVGGMVGVERVVLPLLAEQDFGLASRSAILSFIAGFGAVKAVANLAAGGLSERLGRKGVLIAGWLFGLPVPLLILTAPSWKWIVFANLLLGVNQGLCWSTTVIMKIDLAGPDRRGLAMGLNEAAGYLAVSLAALASAYMAGAYGLRLTPFYLGEAFALAGLLLSGFLVRETIHHARLESGHQPAPVPAFATIFWLTSWKNRSLFAVSQAGLVNNLNDGVAWGLLPLFLASQGYSIEQVGILGGLYPAVWGVAQLATGGLSDRWGRKPMIAGGMCVQAAAFCVLLLARDFLTQALACALLGLGTAMVYPTLLAAVGDAAHPSWRASAVGVYRLWRDAGYAFGALFGGALADWFGAPPALAATAALTLLSGLVVALVMRETR